jgi:hypothetical protein
MTFCATKSAVKTVKSKIEFETFICHYNIQIKNIKVGNGVHASAEFQVSLSAEESWVILL